MVYASLALVKAHGLLKMGGGGLGGGGGGQAHEGARGLEPGYAAQRVPGLRMPQPTGGGRPSARGERSPTGLLQRLDRKEGASRTGSLLFTRHNSYQVRWVGQGGGRGGVGGAGD